VQRDMLEKEPWSKYTRRFSCADWRYAGTLTLFKKGLRKPESVFFNFELEAGKHDENGRVCIAQYASGLRVANLYAPNNGWNEQSNFAARRRWDAQLKQFVRRCHAEKRDLIVVGDLNVAHQDADVSPGHQQWFREQTGVSTSKPWTQKHAAEKIASADVGQPGFTRNEQLRFSEVLQEGHLIDTFRELHPADRPVHISDAAWSWRGSEHQTDKYHAKAMRIDYCLVSESLRSRVRDASILGQGVNRQGCFGSDHAPIFLRLSADDGSDAHDQEAAAGRAGALAAQEPPSTRNETTDDDGKSEEGSASQTSPEDGFSYNRSQTLGSASQTSPEDGLLPAKPAQKDAAAMSVGAQSAGECEQSDRAPEHEEVHIDLTAEDQEETGMGASGTSTRGREDGSKSRGANGMRRQNAAVFVSAPPTGGGAGATAVSSEKGAQGVEEVGRGARLPVVEHDPDNSRFVVSLSSLLAAGAGGGGGGGAGGQGDRGAQSDDEALLTYVMRKRRGAKVRWDSLVGVRL